MLGPLTFPGGDSMSSVTTPQLHISLEFAENLVRHLRDAVKETGRESLLQDANCLQAEIDAHFSQAPLKH